MKMKYISRIDSNYTHCYTVRVGYNIPEATHKTFADGVYGGKRKALKAAIVHRDKELKRLKVTLCKRYKYDKNSQRHWGVGVNENWDRDKNGYDYLHIVGTYWDGRKKKQVHKSFSVNKYGYELAWKLAAQWRSLKLTGEL